jgi:hypothetical protein
MAFRLLSYCTMIHRRTRPSSSLSSSANLLELNGLSAAQEQTCYETREAFLERNRLNSWGLTVKLASNGPESWLLDISVAASVEFESQARSTQVTVDNTVDLAEVVDSCLETHYNSCMNRRAMSPRPPRRAGEGVSHYLIAHA